MSEERRRAHATVGRALYGGMSQALVPGDEAAAPLQVDVPFAIEGERVAVTLADGESRRTGAVAELDQVLQPAPQRVAPGCMHFGTCGGCQYQHMNAALQLQTKAELQHRLLERAGVPAPAPRVHAAEPWHYRNRMRMRVDGGRLGYSRRASNAFLHILECPIVSPLLWRAAQSVEAWTAEGAGRWPAGTAEVEFFATADDGALQLALHVDADVATLDRDAPATFRALCAALVGRVPQLRGGGLLVHGQAAPGASRRVQQRQRVEVARWGEPGLTYTVNGREYAVSRGAFFQVNRFLTGTLVDLVVASRSGEMALDLFAGAGLFSLPLTERFRTVVAVEVGQPAAADLHWLLQARGPQHRAVPQTTLAFLRGWTPAMGTPGLVVVDPPRAGLGADTVRALVPLNAPEIVYVSCDPTTLARDARTLIDSRYAVEELHMIDLFPQTSHLETVAVFRLR